MNFTDLELVLLVAIPILLWRIYVLRRVAERNEEAADIFARCFINIGEGKGTVVKRDDGVWFYKEKEK